MSISTAEVLWQHVQEDDLCPGSDSLEEWLAVRWIRVRIRGRAVPLIPVVGYRDALLLHDVHHALTGYDTSLCGELELAAWELASGGCRSSIPFWIDRLLALLLGLVLVPRRMLRAARAGRPCKNLYGERPARILALDFDEVRRRVGCPLDAPGA
jgi:hypothetical protein